MFLAILLDVEAKIEQLCFLRIAVFLRHYYQERLLAIIIL